MRYLYATVLAAALFGAAALNFSAEAAPAAAGPATAPATSGHDVLRHFVNGCHRSIVNHFSDRYGRRLWHYHSNRCRAHRAAEPRRHHSRRESRRYDRHSNRESRYGRRGRRGDCVWIGPVRVCD